jgi:putative ABC transport system permease protein
MRESDVSGGGETTTTVTGEWIPPIDEFRELPGVEAATRVGDYAADVKLATGNQRARFIGIDRIDFDKTAWFREDFAYESLGSLMNRLASAPQSILVSRAFLEENALRVGDPITIDVFPEAGARLSGLFLVAGLYEHFPTSEPDEIVIIGNLDHVFSFFGVTMPHNIWLQLAEGAEPTGVLATVDGDMGLVTLNEQDARAILLEEQAKMERVGVFGTLSVSFVAATVMAALGLLTYTYASLQERRQQFAVVRAVGLYHNQVIRQVAIEYTILMIFGAIAGIAVGTVAATLFVPLFRVVGGAAPQPPLIPIVAAAEVIPLAVSFIGVMLVAELIIIGVALKGRLFTALRM